MIIADLDPAVCSLYIDEYSCTYIDSRANIPVMGKHAYSMADTGQTSDVNAFTPDHKNWLFMLWMKPSSNIAPMKELMLPW